MLSHSLEPALLVKLKLALIIQNSGNFADFCCMVIPLEVATFHSTISLSLSLLSSFFSVEKLFSISSFCRTAQTDFERMKYKTRTLNSINRFLFFFVSESFLS